MVQWQGKKKLFNFFKKNRIYNINVLSPLITKKNEGTLTLEEILDSNDAINDLKLNPSSQLKDL